MNSRCGNGKEKVRGGRRKEGDCRGGSGGKEERKAIKEWTSCGIGKDEVDTEDKNKRIERDSCHWGKGEKTVCLALH